MENIEVHSFAKRLLFRSFTQSGCDRPIVGIEALDFLLLRNLLGFSTSVAAGSPAYSVMN